MASQSLPSASVGQAPPNFYETAAKMGSTPQAKGSPDDKQEFLKDVTKLLTILGKMGKRKPNGVDISKQMKAAADAVQQALVAVADDTASTGPSGDATGDATASAGSQAPPDTGASGGAS